MIRLSKERLFHLFHTICKPCPHALPSVLLIDIPWLYITSKRKERKKEERKGGREGRSLKGRNSEKLEERKRRAEGK